MSLKSTLIGAVASCAVLFAFGAQAKTFDLTFTSPLGNGSAVLQATPDGGQYLVGSATGEIGGAPLSLIGPGGFAGNDNLVNAGAPALDFAGLSFAAGGSDYNIYFDNGSYVGPGYAICSQCSGGNETLLTSFSLSAAPEPATWAMLIVGVAMIGFAARRRSQAAALAA